MTTYLISVEYNDPDIIRPTTAYEETMIVLSTDIEPHTKEFWMELELALIVSLEHEDGRISETEPRLERYDIKETWH